MYTSFPESYSEKSIRNLILSFSIFLSNPPIKVINTLKLTNDLTTASAVDVQLEIEASESLTDVPAYCLLIYDCMYNKYLLLGK